jgi:calnexin
MFFVLLIVSVSILSLSQGLQPEGLFFYESFDEDVFASGRWVKSSNRKYAKQPVMWKAATNSAPGFEDDKGLQLTQEMKHYGFGAKLPQPFSPEGRSTLIFQYEVKFEEKLECGGAYVKLLRGPRDVDMADLSNDTPYSIMFGPDKCGNDNKVHFIVQHQNPVTKVWTEHHLKGPPKAKLDKFTHLYTLHIMSDNSFQIFIDAKPVASGSLLRDFAPPINPSTDIDDPVDTKPSDWVDLELIDDPLAEKPDDWDESIPKRIPNPMEIKPPAWDESLPTHIPDPLAVKPEDWDDEEVFFLCLMFVAI